MALKALIVAACLLLAGGCGSPSHFEPAVLQQVYVKDFQSDEPEACTTADVPLQHAQAQAFFARATPVDHQTLNDNYPVAPCRLVGTARYRGRACDWSISAARTGWLQCGSQRWHYACDDCDALFAAGVKGSAR